MKSLRVPFLTALCILSILIAGCSSSTSQPLTTRIVSDRTQGYTSTDGTYVGPRGKSDHNGIPLEVGVYGKRKTHKGNLTITEEGTTLTNIDVTGAILVNADNVTITNFSAERVTQKPGQVGMVLEDGTINGKNKKNDGIQWNNFVARRMNISGTFDGIKAQGNVVIEDSYIHDMYAFRSEDAGAGGYSHNDCIQVSSGKNIVIRRNWLDNCGNNSAIFIDPDQGIIENVLVQYNYLNSGGYTLYAIASRTAENGIPANVRIEFNVFGDAHQFDYATIAGGITFSNNTTTTGSPITAKIDDDIS